MLPAEDYRKLILAGVHDMRVDPYDQFIKDQLADLIEEHGRSDAMHHTIPLLRNGKCVCNSLDISGAKSLIHYLATIHSNFPHVCKALGRLSASAWYYLEPAMYGVLWTLIYDRCGRVTIAIPPIRTDRLLISHGKLIEVSEESKLVWDDRMAGGDKFCGEMRDLIDLGDAIRKTPKLEIYNDPQ